MTIKNRRFELELSFATRSAFVRLGSRELFVGRDAGTGRWFID